MFTNHRITKNCSKIQTRYNYITRQVEAEREANIIPNISYKIEF